MIANSFGKQCSVLLFMLATMIAGGCSSKGVTEDIRTIDLGEVPEGPSINVEFIIANHSASSIRLTAVERSCACQVVKFDREREIQTGEQICIAAEVPTVGLDGPHSYHFIAKTTSNEPAYESIPLSVTAQIKPKIKVSPSEINFGKLTSNKFEPRAITVISYDAPLARNLGRVYVKQRLPMIAIEERLDVNQPNMSTYDVRLLKTSVTGDIVASIIFEFEDRDIGSITVPVRGRIEGMIVPTPRSLVVRPNYSDSYAVRLRAKKGQVFTITRVEHNDLLGVHSLRNEKFEHKYVIDVAQDCPAGDYTVIFYTDIPDQSTIVLPVIVKDI